MRIKIGSLMGVIAGLAVVLGVVIQVPVFFQQLFFWLMPGPVVFMVAWRWPGLAIPVLVIVDTVAAAIVPGALAIRQGAGGDALRGSMLAATILLIVAYPAALGAGLGHLGSAGPKAKHTAEARPTPSRGAIWGMMLGPLVVVVPVAHGLWQWVEAMRHYHC